jgi:hypothetical protein
MKIRIKGNSIRLRLTKSDVDRFDKEGKVEETTDLGTVAFGYVLQRSSEVDQLTAAFNDGRITMYMPEVWAQEWTTTDRVGFDSHVPLGNGVEGGLYLLLEKDFKCLDETVEDQSDNYDNPLANKA